MSAAKNNSTTTPLVFNIITFRGYEFAVEPFVGPYVLVTLCGSDLPSKQARRTRAAIQSAIIALYEDMTPPTPPAAPARVRLLEVVRTYAVNSHKDNIVNIDTLIAASDGKSRAGKALEALRNLQNEIGEQPWLLAAIDACHALEYNPSGVTKTGKPRKSRAKTSPADAGARGHKLALPKYAVGERYPASTTLYAAARLFESKHGFASNNSYIDATGMLYVCYDPKINGASVSAA